MIKRSLRSKLLLVYIISIVIVMVTVVMTSNFIYRPMLILDTRDSMVGYSKLISSNYVKGSDNLKRDIDKLDSSHDKAFQSLAVHSAFPPDAVLTSHDACSP